MKLFDRYVLKKFLGAFVFVVLIILLVIVIIDMAEKTEKFARNNLSTAEILGYYVNFIPWIANQLTPIIAFIATVFVTARLAGHTEIVAILSSGVSFQRFLLPYFVGACLIAGLSFAFSGWVIPKSNKKRLTFEQQYFNKGKKNFSKRDFHIQIAPEVYLYMRNYDNQSHTGYRFTLEELKGLDMTQKLYSDKIVWNDSTEKWTLKDWQLRIMNDSTEIVTTGEEMDTVLAIHPDEFANKYREFDAMTLTELTEHINMLKSRGVSGVEFYEVEKYIRFASPFAILILTFMGVIVSSKKTRGGAGFQIALGFLLSFIFLLFFMMTKTIAEAGSMPAILAVWIPNIVFGSISIILYKTVPR